MLVCRVLVVVVGDSGGRVFLYGVMVEMVELRVGWLLCGDDG